MSASGKSSNRRYEYELGRAGGGHGIYAAEGRADKKREDERRAAEAERASVIPPGATE